MEKAWKLIGAVGLFLLGAGVLIMALQPLLAAPGTSELMTTPIPGGAAAETSAAEQSQATETKETTSLDSLLNLQGLTKVIPQEEALEVQVVDSGGDGWTAQGTGYGIASLDLEIQELSGRDIYLTSIGWILYDARGTKVLSGMLPIDEYLPAYGSVYVPWSVQIREGEAYLLDVAYQVPLDTFGVGILVFNASGRTANNGLEMTSIEGSTSITVFP